jgi:hypothetical protein
MFETYLTACATLVPVTASLAEACKLKAGFHEIFFYFSILCLNKGPPSRHKLKVQKAVAEV